MKPPGRRRRGPQCALSSLLTVALLLLTSTASAASAVLGIDLGTEYIKAALVKPGIPLEIVLTKDSKRKEIAAVAFKSSSSSPQDGEINWPERLYGGDALALAARFPGDVYANLKPLLGIEYTTDVLYPARNPALEIVPLQGRQTVGFRSRSLPNEEMPFSVEELLAMQLKNVRENAETLAGKIVEIRDAVITVPPYYTADERRAVGLAAELAGLNVLALISDGLAVGLNYATSREFPSVSEGAKPEYHMVLDMGAGGTTATVVRFQGKTVKDVGRFNKTVQEVAVMGAGWDKTLGGDTLNVLVRDDMIAKFVQSSGAKSAGLEESGVRSNGRTMAKLWKEAERIRQVLSANTEASTSFEGLHEDVDFRFKLSRADFENLASDFATRVDRPLQRALQAANLTMEELDSVILHGGLVRTPFIQKRLEGLALNAAKLRSNVNADEAAVFGAVFRGAGLSPSFRVKEIRDTDAAGYAAGIKWIAEGKDRHQKLFTSTSQIGPSKQVTFKNVEDFSFTTYQQVPTGDESFDLVDREVGTIKTGNLTASVAELVDKHGCRRDNITTKFTVRLDPLLGVPEVTQGTISCEAEPEKAGVVDGVKGFFGFGGKKSDQQPLAGEESPPEPVEEASPTPSTSAAEGEAPTTASSADPVPKVPKKKTVSINLSFNVEPRGLPMPSAAELMAMKKRLVNFDASDRTRKQREEIFNTLEGLTYRVRDLLEDEAFIAVSSKEQRSSLQAQVSATSEWLYGEGSTASLEALRTKLSDLKSLVDPILKRKDEVSRRPESIRGLQEALDQIKKLVAIIRDQVDAASSASASLQSASSTTTIQSSSSPTIATNDFADLEDETTTWSSTTMTASPTPSSYFSPYTAEDVAEISSIYETTNSWLTEKLTEQEKLSAFDDPVLLSYQLQDRTKRLNDVVAELLARKMKLPPRSSKSKAAKPKTKKTKSKTSTATDTAPSAAETSSSAGAQKSIPVMDFTDGEGIMNEDGSINEEKLQQALKRQGHDGKIHDEL